ncbi:type IV secretory system conjugative DNA transfer family protein [Erysipelothrix rhusiopathiae]|nr:type IV secretory system conjugative DNA transfer family protein [Erysipelothrix rhusiopathiae]MDE8321985.1 type IV secretory system conjugative DNA transfer family protein [Erysipelothrix rhusiopathiae]
MAYIISITLYILCLMTYVVLMSHDSITSKVIVSNILPSLMNIKWQYLLSSAIIFILIPLYIDAGKRAKSSAHKKQIKGDLHGSGAWADIKEIKENYHAYSFKDFYNDNKVPSGWLVYYDNKTNTHYFDTTPVSALTLAPARRGKTTAISIPEILYNAKSDASMLIPDTKGEMLDLVKPILDDLGIQVKNYNLDDTEFSDKYNLIGDVSDYWDKHIDALNRGAITESNKALALCQQNALIIAEQMILATKREDTGAMHSFFFGTSIGWIASCILLVVQFAPRHLRHFPSVVAVCKDLAVRSFKNNQLGAILSTLESDNLAVSVAGGALSAEKELLNNVTSSVLDAMQPFENKALLNVFNYSESNNLEDTINQQTFTFLNFPLNNASACSIASLMITQHVEGLAVIAKATQSDGSNEVGKLKRPYRVEGEEIGNIPAIKGMEKYLSLYQGFGITFSLVFQDYTQIKRRYGNNAETILKNADVKRYIGFNADDVDFGKRVSQALGTITVETKSQSNSYRGGYGTGTNHSTSTNLIKRELMTVEEVLQTKDAIIMKSPNRPLKTRFIAYYEESFPVKLKRSGYQGRNVGFDNLKVFNGVDLYNVISANQNKNPNQLSINDAELEVITQNYIDAKLPHVKDFLSGTLTEEMKREIELAMISIDENIAKEISKFIQKQD